MFVDDLKVHTGDKGRLTEVVSMVEEVSGAMGMELGLRKCAVAHMVRGRKVMEGGIKMESGKEMEELEEGEVYCYLGVAQRFGADPTKTKRRVEREYITRTREVWRSEIGVRKKVEAQNVWGVGVMRYSLGTSDWTRSDMREMDRITRRILRQNGAHQYGASVARLYLPREEGGRGLVCLEQAWETETLAAVNYLHNNADPQVRQAMGHMEEEADNNPNGLVSHAKRICEKYDLETLLPTQGDQINPTKIANKVRNEQKRRLREERRGKTIHGVFAIETSRPECDRVATHAWLKNGSFRAETEGLIIAAQDGVIHTAAYRHRMLGETGNPMCGECRKAVETLGHILAACEGFKWSLYKATHDGILNVLVGVAARKLGVRIPANRWDANQVVKSAVYGGERATILVDQCIPTKGQIEARRPDLLIRMPGERKITILEVACAWKPLVKEQEAQKKAKYRELAAEVQGPKRGSGDWDPGPGGRDKKGNPQDRHMGGS